MLVLGLTGHYLSGEDGQEQDLSPEHFHDAAACLIKDGELLAAVEEERFNRIKKTTHFPVNAIRACIGRAGISPAEIDAVGFNGTEAAVNLLHKVLCVGNPEVPVRCASRDTIIGNLKDAFGLDLPNDRLRYTEHHVAHAMSSFIRSGMKEALVVVMDGAGEWHSTTVFRGSGGQLESLATYGQDKSLGMLYNTTIKLLGYGLGDEYKVMGLAPYGNPGTYRDVFSQMFTLKDKGDFDLHMERWIFLANAIPLRRKGQDFIEPHMDLAAALQQTLEKVAMHVLDYWAAHTGLANLCFVGGVAHNSTLNGLILRSGLFREVFIHPASHDAGTAEGAALAAARQLDAAPFRLSRLRTAAMGPDLGTSAEIEKQLASWGDLIEYEQPADIVDAAAALLAGGAVLGWAHGPSEYGPRALGNRSILADARPGENKQRINAMVKKREAYRPFAPVVTPEAAEAYFDIPRTRANYDFMSFVVSVRQDRRAELGAVTHIDGSARVQIIDPAANERFHRLVRRFGELTGTPVLLNTSFNNNAEPIVQSVHDALTCFLTTELDFLVVEDFLIRRRPGGSLAFDGLIPRFRPLTRLARRVGVTSAGHKDVVHEIYLEHGNGPRAGISPAAYTLLEAADGTQTLESLAGPMGGVTDDIRRELHRLWQGRFLVLRPPAACSRPP